MPQLNIPPVTGKLAVDPQSLLTQVDHLGRTGRNTDGILTRLTGSAQDKEGRDLLVSCFEAEGLSVSVDTIGNIFGWWRVAGDLPPLMLGSHIDTVIDAGIYDGCYGVLSALACLRTLRASGYAPSRPLVVAAFTNEEGVRYQPDMLGSLTFAGGLPLDAALQSVGTDGTILCDELNRIGYQGTLASGSFRPAAYLELHIEQGPVLDAEGYSIGAVTGVQGISWQQVVIDGIANHAGTTPMAHRHDAGFAAARIATFVHDYAVNTGGTSVATIGTLSFEPNAINVVPARASLTVDIRDADDARLTKFEAELEECFGRIAKEEGVRITSAPLARFVPVPFDSDLISLVEQVAETRGLTCRRITSGAGHDAQMLARICPSAMIFVPSRKGISHNPQEFTAPEHLVAGANVLLDCVIEVLRRLDSRDQGAHPQ